MDTAHALCAHNYLVPPPPRPQQRRRHQQGSGVARCGLNLSQQVTSFYDALWLRFGLLSTEPDPQHLSKVTAATLPRVCSLAFCGRVKRNEMGNVLTPNFKQAARLLSGQLLSVGQPRASVRLAVRLPAPNQRFLRSFLSVSKDEKYSELQSE